MSKCWYCNNELTTGDSPKHFGICNKCYDEMFKSGDAIIRSLTNKIAELQYQLEASETQKRRHFEQVKILDKENKELKELLEEVQGQYGYECECNKQFVDCQQENDLLKQQLKNQPAEIVEKIKKQIFNHFNVKNMEEYENLSLIDSLFTADVVIEMLDIILKEYQK